MGLTGPVQPNDIVMRASEIGTTIPGIASLAMKSARKGAQRGVQGIYQLPSGQEPTPEFMNVSQQNLNNQTQQMTDMLNMMAPEDEQLAYINEQEAGILNLLGGSGEMTPQGIPSFRMRGRFGGSNDNDNDNNNNNNNNNNNSGGGGNMPQGFVEAEGEAEATAKAVEKAEKEAAEAAAAAENNYGRPNMGDITGGYNTPTGDTPSANNPDLGPDDKKQYDAIKDAEQAIEDAVVTNINPITGVKTTVKNINPLTGEITDVIAGTQRKKAEGELQDLLDRIDFVNSVGQAEETLDLAKKGISRDKAYAMTGLDESIGVQDLTDGYGQSSLSGMEDRLGELTAKAKANDITSTELDELAQLNKFYGKNPTTGMGFLESLEYQVTNPEFKADLKKAAPLLGAAALTAFAPLGVKSIFSIGRALMSFTDQTPKSLRDTMQKALDKLTGGEKKALAKTLPSTYRGFGIQGENRGQGEDRREEEARRRREAEADTGTGEEDTSERDRFERSFANRYFVGPASLDEVRKYAVTDGGYNQLTPFYGREKETV